MMMMRFWLLVICGCYVCVLANSEQRSAGNGSNHLNSSTMIANSELS